MNSIFSLILSFILFVGYYQLGFCEGDMEKQPESASGYLLKKPFFAKEVIVTSANRYATEAGLAILEEGGNAIDAAVAMQLVLTLVEPQSSGIGGGAFLLFYEKESKEIIAYDGRETAPFAAEPTLFLDENKNPIPNNEAMIGGRSVGVPGVLKMLEMAHLEKGSLPWATLFEPAIKLATQGFIISPRLHTLLTENSHIKNNPHILAYFFTKEKKPLPSGTLLKNRELADTFKLLSLGIEPFYSGEIAEDIINAVRSSRNPGLLTLEDFKGYRPLKRTPIETIFNDFIVYGFPPPSSGGIAIAQMLSILENKDSFSFPFDSSQFINLFSGASLLTFADRNTYIGDPDFVNVPVERLVDPLYLKQRSELISPYVATKKIEPGQIFEEFAYAASGELSSTSHLCVVDREGNAVSMTTSIENAFGSALMVRGFFLNNQLTDFSFIPEHDGKKVANSVEGGKRPLSSMTPTIVLHKKNRQPYLLLGSAGGARIIDYVAKALIGTLFFNLNIQESINFPNIAAIDDHIDLEENTFLEKKIETLKNMGNEAHLLPLTSGTQGIQIEDTVLIGSADPRREGEALGS